MPSHRFSKELISRDYGSHCDFSCLMSKHLVHKTSEQRVEGIITSAVRMEQRFLLDAFAGEFPGMNYSLMKQYTEFVTDLLLLDLGFNREFSEEKIHLTLQRIYLGKGGLTSLWRKEVTLRGWEGGWGQSRILLPWILISKWTTCYYFKTYQQQK